MHKKRDVSIPLTGSTFHPNAARIVLLQLTLGHQRKKVTSQDCDYCNELAKQTPLYNILTELKM